MERRAIKRTSRPTITAEGDGRRRGDRKGGIVCWEVGGEGGGGVQGTTPAPPAIKEVSGRAGRPIVTDGWSILYPLQRRPCEQDKANDFSAGRVLCPGALRVRNTTLLAPLL